MKFNVNAEPSIALDNNNFYQQCNNSSTIIIFIFLIIIFEFSFIFNGKILELNLQHAVTIWKNKIQNEIIIFILFNLLSVFCNFSFQFFFVFGDIKNIWELHSFLALLLTFQLLC